jgi:uncharacterized membrane protein
LDKSFWIWESNMGLCAKCFGFYLTQPLIYLFILKKEALEQSRLAFPFSLFLFTLMAVDSIFLKFSTSNTQRLLLGLLGGIGFVGIISRIYFRKGDIMETFWRRKRVVILLVIVLLYLLSILSVASAQNNAYVTLRAGTPVMLEVLDLIDSKRYTLGQTVPIVVARAVKIDDYAVVLPHTEVFAKVASVESASGWGSEGKITIVVESTTAVDGQEIMLTGTQYAEGSSSHGTATAVGVGTGLLCLPLALTGFAVKGDEGKIIPGSKIKATIDADYKIAVLGEDKVRLQQAETDKRLNNIKVDIEQRRQKEIEEQKKLEEEKKTTDLPARVQ